MEVALGADVTVLVVDWLRAQLVAEGGYVAPHVGTLVPAARPSLFVTVSRTGGPLRDHVVDDAQVTVDSWGPTDEAAQDLAQWCRALMHAASGRLLAGHQVYRVAELAGPALVADPVSDQPRYRASYQVPVRCTVTA